MQLKATQIIQAIAKHGYVPSAFICIGPFDEGKALPKAGLTLNKTTAPGHQRMLACSFDPLPEGAADPLADNLNTFVQRTGGKVLSVGKLQLGALEGRHVQIGVRGQEGGVVMHAIAVAVTGVIHRYSLTAAEERSAEALEALEALVSAACA